MPHFANVVTAVAEIANTLVRLHERLQIHHRDIKPSKLYLLDGQPAISDFGLVDLPESEALTIDGKATRDPSLSWRMRWSRILSTQIRPKLMSSP